jgi:hypothetical protein
MLSGKTGAQSRQPWFLSAIIIAGFRPGSRGPFVSAKGPKTMLAVAYPFGCPARFTDTGGGQTRLAQTLPAFSPVAVSLLGHATRPGGAQRVKVTQLAGACLEPCRRAQKRSASCEERPSLGPAARRRINDPPGD